MLGSLQAREVGLHSLPEFILGSLHELTRNLLLVALPIVLGHPDHAQKLYTDNKINSGFCRSNQIFSQENGGVK